MSAFPNPSHESNAAEVLREILKFVSRTLGRLSLWKFPNPSHEPNAAEVLREILSFAFSLLSPSDQQDEIEQISKQHVERLEGGTEEDLRRKQFAELLNEAPVRTQGALFLTFMGKFNREKSLCKAILLFRQLDSNEQQKSIEEMFGELSWMRTEELKDVILERLSEECEDDFRLRRFIKLCSTYDGLMASFISYHLKEWDPDALLMQASGNEEIEEIKQSRYAEYYLGLSIIWFKARWASDPEGLIHSIISKFGEGDRIIEKLVNETEVEFRLRRFTESFKQIPFGYQENIVERIKDIIFGNLGIPIARLTSLEEMGWGGGRVGVVSAGADFYEDWDEDLDEEFADEFMRMRTPNPKVSVGAQATQGEVQGATAQVGQGATTQGGQGTGQQ